MIKKLNDNDYVKTSDLPLAGAIHLDFPIEVLDRSNPGKVVFVFRREPGVDQIIEQFWRRQLRVEPLSYFNSIKTLKARIYER